MNHTTSRWASARSLPDEGTYMALKHAVMGNIGLAPPDEQILAPGSAMIYSVTLAIAPVPQESSCLAVS